MAAYLVDWLSLAARWAHVVTGIAWIGASFYFIWLDDKLEAASDPDLAGKLDAIHGGGFYHVVKYKLAPRKLPATLHWFKWEAYWTFFTGFALLALLYYWSAELYLIDAAVMALSKPAAIAAGLGTLVVGLAVYEGLCRSPLGKNDRALAVAIFILLCPAAYALTHLFSGRGAFLHFGAMLGTIMVANVAHVIIPGQKELVRAKREGRAPDPRYAAAGKQRSVHNTYFTLPVLFTMLSGHYPMTFSSRWNWVVLIAMTLAGALVRTWFVIRHKRAAPAWLLAAGVASALAAVWIAMPKDAAPAKPVAFAEVQAVVAARCLPCHAAKPTFAGLAEPPKGVALDTPEKLRAYAPQIRQQAVVSRAMPPGNLTGLTDEERAVLARWTAPGGQAE
ncbi:MAG: urate hydroxylase PuuD [Betaproteobacteria bacterium]|nr:urate hydroxylase PuuD [Betaproteobacteria bacterium]